MTTSMASEVAQIRRILNDAPDQDLLNGAISSTTATTFVVDTPSKWAAGNVWEFDDGAAGAEQVRVTSVDTSTSTITVTRGHGGSTAATHADNCVILKNPSFRYDTIAQAANTVLDADLFENDVYDLIEHQVTSNSDGSTDYNAPASTCEEWMAVYQKTSTMTRPSWFPSNAFTRYPNNVDTALYANGKMFSIYQNLGTPGTDIFYVTCRERLTITTLSATQERILQWLACAYLLEWTEPRRAQGPTNQGDRTVRPGTGIGDAAYYRTLAARVIQAESSRLRKLNPPTKVWRAR